jgi:hypothetical protein
MKPEPRSPREIEGVPDAAAGAIPPAAEQFSGIKWRLVGPRSTPLAADEIQERMKVKS